VTEPEALARAREIVGPFALRNEKYPCDCIDRNGNTWPGCTCDHGWRTIQRGIAIPQGMVQAIAAELRKESERAEELKVALTEWLALADHQGLSTTRHRERTRKLCE
jgi:hypothetical protein